MVFRGNCGFPIKPRVLKPTFGFLNRQLSQSPGFYSPRVFQKTQCFPVKPGVSYSKPQVRTWAPMRFICGCDTKQCGLNHNTTFCTPLANLLRIFQQKDYFYPSSFGTKMFKYSFLSF